MASMRIKVAATSLLAPSKTFMFSCKTTLIAVLLTSLCTLIAGHAIVTSPVPRAIGAEALAACGTGVYNSLKANKYGPIEFSASYIDSGYNAAACHLFFCRGLQYKDNTANTRVYTPGSVVSFHVDIQAHHTGTANVSVVDLASQTTIGQPLFYWPVYADNTVGPANWPKNESDFNVTIPSNLGNKCTKTGACAIQWWWYAYSNGQTYESCVDFTTPA